MNHHTRLDLVALDRHGINPEHTQPREHAVPCAMCGAMTCNVYGNCDTHHKYPARWTKPGAARSLAENVDL